MTPQNIDGKIHRQVIARLVDEIYDATSLGDTKPPQDHHSEKLSEMPGFKAYL